MEFSPVLCNFLKSTLLTLEFVSLTTCFSFIFAIAIFTALSPNSSQAPTWYGLNNIWPFSSNTSTSCHSKIIKLFIKRSPFLFQILHHEFDSVLLCNFFSMSPNVNRLVFTDLIYFLNNRVYKAPQLTLRIIFPPWSFPIEIFT